MKFLPDIRRSISLHRQRHVCELGRGSESQLPYLPPNAPFKARFKRQLQKILLVWDNHPYARFYLRSRAALAYEKRRHGISGNWWIVHPCSKFRFFWDNLMVFVYLYMFIATPFALSFYRLPKQQHNHIEFATGATMSRLLMPGYVTCLADIVVNCVTGYINNDGRDIIIDPVLIVWHYVKRMFIIDLLSSIPYTWVYEERLGEPGPDVVLWLLIPELLPLFKFFRLSTLRHYMKEIIMYCGASRVYQQSMWIIVLTILIVHLSACFTYFLPIFYAYIYKTPKEKADSFLFATKLYEEPTWYVYLTSLHMSGGNLCSYNFPEFKFIDFPDNLARSILLLIGMAYFLYVTVVVLQLVRSCAEPQLKYQSIICGVKSYIRNKKLPKKLKERLLHFYQHRFQGSLFKEKAITSTLSKHLKNEITQHSSRILLESTPLFSNISHMTLDNIIGALKQVIFLQDDVIYKCASSGKCMYFILTGTVAVISCSGKEICHVTDGDYFGTAALFEHEHKRTTSIIALEVCEVLRFDRRDFNRLVPINSEFYKRLKIIAQKRREIVAEYEHELGEIKNIAQENDKDPEGKETSDSVSIGSEDYAMDDLMNELDNQNDNDNDDDNDAVENYEEEDKPTDG